MTKAADILRMLDAPDAVIYHLRGPLDVVVIYLEAKTGYREVVPRKVFEELRDSGAIADTSYTDHTKWVRWTKVR